MPEYVATEVGDCPNCGGRYPGHVHKVPQAGVHAWTCPACEYTSEPSDVSNLRRVEVDESESDSEERAADTEDEEPEVVTDGGAPTYPESDLDYWSRQLRAALERMEPETKMTIRKNAHDIVVAVASGSSRAERAELVAALERRGFEIVSTTTEEYVRVNATADRLKHSFAEPGGNA